MRYEIRAALESDVDGLLELSKFLDTVNLPHDREAIRGLVTHSLQSFSGEIGDVRRREYLFVLYDNQDQRCVGTSMVIGQLGRREAPYIYFDVLSEEKYSVSLEKHFDHKVLSIGYSFKGPTELGGLVMHPDYRQSKDKLGMLISYVRFLWIAMHRSDFQDEVVAELLPPLEKDGTSYLWEAIGRRFTGMTYQEADKLSKTNKEFIRSLFPDGDIYVSLLSQDAQDVVGKVGPQTRGVEKLLRRIGFRYAERVDPFDGGPHFIAATNEITLVSRSTLAHATRQDTDSGSHVLIGIEYDDPPRFRAVRAIATQHSDQHIGLSSALMSLLGIHEGDEVWVLPIDRP